MWSTTPTFDAALLAPNRYPVSRFTMRLAGDDGGDTDLTQYVKTWKLDRTPSDTPDQASRFAGSIAAKLVITLDSGLAAPGQPPTFIAALSPYQASANPTWYRQDWGVGCRVTLRTGYYTSAGAETIQVFTGRVDNVSFDHDGVMTLTCLDDLVQLQADVDLPPVVVAEGDPPMMAYSVVEHVLRSGGMLRTPAAPTTGSTTMLSVPALFPEIGAAASPLRFATDPGSYHLHAAPSYDVEYTTAITYTPKRGTSLSYLARVKAPTAHTFERALMTLGDGTFGLKFKILTTGAIWAGAIDNSASVQTAAGVMPADNGWHSVLIELRHAAGGGTSLRFTVDGVVTTASAPFLDLAVQDSQSGKVVIGGLVHEGLIIRFHDQVVAGQPFASNLLNGWTPNYDTDLRGIEATIRAIPRGSSGKALDVIRSLATGIGAVFRIREDGVWRWEERASWAAKRVMGPVVTLSADRDLIASGVSYSGASRRKSVSIDWTEYSARKSTATTPLWSATDTIVAPLGESVVNIDTEVALASIFPVRVTTSLDPRWSSAVVVPASQVGNDFAEQLVNKLIIRVRPTATGFQLRMVNLYSRPVALWSPVTMAPFFSLQGYAQQGANPMTFTMEASPRSVETLTLDPSPWRQNQVQALSMAAGIAADVALPTVLFNDQTVLANPALTVDDVVTVQTDPLTMGPVAVQIVALASDDVEMTATIRACYAPVGLVLGVAGRNTLPGLLAV